MGAPPTRIEEEVPVAKPTPQELTRMGAAALSGWLGLSARDGAETVDAASVALHQALEAEDAQRAVAEVLEAHGDPQLLQFADDIAALGPSARLEDLIGIRGIAQGRLASLTAAFSSAATPTPSAATPTPSGGEAPEVQVDLEASPDLTARLERLEGALAEALAALSGASGVAQDLDLALGAFRADGIRLRLPSDPGAALQRRPAEGVIVPQVLSREVEGASEALEGLGLHVQRSFNAATRARPGTVVSQEPVAGRALPPGSVVHLVVAR